MAIAGLLLSAMLVTGFAEAQVYRWVDAEGNVHFTDRPPPEKDAERLPIRTQRTDLEATIREEIEREEYLSLRDQDRADDAHDAEAERQDREAMRRSCEQARERVATIEGARRLVRVDEDGNRRDYDEAQRAAALAEARAQVAEWCR